MNAPQRRQIRRNILLGLALTAITIAIDQVNGLHRLEGWFYDRRVSLCQHFTPPPTDKLVHLDIDDASRESIGAWPWPRTYMAKIIEELHREGASTLAIDVLYTDTLAGANARRTNATTQQATIAAPAVERFEDPGDLALAASFKDFGRVVLAASFTLGEKQAASDAHRALVAMLTKNLELTQDEVDAAMKAKGLPAVSTDEFFAALHESTAARVLAEPGGVSNSLVELEHSLLPRLSAFSSSVQGRIVEREFDRQKSLVAIDRMLAPPPVNAPPVYGAVAEEAPLPCLSEAASGIGCVTILPGNDGVVRYVPLWIQDRGKFVPQFGLAFACAYLGADLKRVEFRDKEMIVPRPQGDPLVIPIWSDVATSGQRVGACFDVPMFGRYQGWEEMYDFPNHKTAKQHIPISVVWDVIQTRERIRQNNVGIEMALTELLGQFDKNNLFPKFKSESLSADDTAAHLKWIDTVFKNEESIVRMDLEDYDSRTTAEKLASGDRVVMENIAAQRNDLQKLAEQDRALQNDLVKMQQKLRGQVSDKGVLIGWVATGTIDFRATSLNPDCPGVVVHGAIFNALVSGYMWSRVPKWQTNLATLVVGLLTTAIVVGFHARRALIGTILVIGGYWLINAEWFFDYHRTILGAAGPTVAAGLIWSGVTLVRLVAEVTEHNRIRRRFSTYVDPILVNYVTEHPELLRLEGEVREMTVAFTDLAGFTTLAETLREKTVAVLSRYTSRMVPVIRRNRGLVNKFMGDGIMFSFGAPYANPEHASDAVNAVLELHEELARFNQELVKEGFPMLGMRAGVGTGEIVVGDTGGDQACDYTCMGDVVNFSSRLEAANKAFGTRSLLSARTVELLNGKFLVRPIGRVQVVGKKIGVMSFEPICRMDQATAEQKQDVEMTVLMVEHYVAARFVDCLSTAEELHRLFPSKLTHLYLELARKALADPPEHFSGNIVLDHK